MNEKFDLLVFESSRILLAVPLREIDIEDVPFPSEYQIFFKRRHLHNRSNQKHQRYHCSGADHCPQKNTGWQIRPRLLDIVHAGNGRIAAFCNGIIWMVLQV